MTSAVYGIFRKAILEKKQVICTYQDRHREVCPHIPRLRRHIDFVHIPAVKDASDEAKEARHTAFSTLVERAVRANLKIDERIEGIRENAKAEIDAMARDHRKVLASLTNKIESEYQRFNPSGSRIHLNWGQFDKRSLDINLPAVELLMSDDLIKNPIQRFGHGTQRNYLIAILLVSASYDFTRLQTLIIACEEPELYQHPPQVACTRFRRHQVRCFNGTGGGSWSGGSLHASSSLKRCG